MKINKSKTLAEAIQETVTPDVMATIEATEKHKEEADKANAEAEKVANEFVKGEEKYAKKSANNSKKLKLSEDLDDGDEYVNVFGEVYKELVNEFPNAKTRSGFNSKETEGFVKILLVDDADKEIAKNICDKHGCEYSANDRVVTITAPTHRKKSDSVTVHDLFDEIHAQLTADGDKYDIWGKSSDNKGAGYLAGDVEGRQIGGVRGDFDRDTITVTVHPDDKKNGRVDTLDPAIKIADHYKENGVTYSIKDATNGDQVMTIVIPDKKASLKDPRVKYSSTGRPIYQGDKRKNVKESTDVTDQVIIDVREDGFLTKMADLRSKGYRRLWAGEGKICMVKEKDLEESKKLTEDNYGWQVKPGEEEDLYEELCNAWGEDDVNMQIVQAMGTDDLGEYLEFICRMNDFHSKHFADTDDDMDVDPEDIIDESRRTKRDPWGLM